ncbi:hypothetical protein AACH06_23570 [Ideonella sp. DXS29W]|uniref:Uncharacterized protein n=1 Tax=Ideonella lacteola TaxID=2984193 RepID=A0ABU9BVP2_9BURK
MPRRLTASNAMSWPIPLVVYRRWLPARPEALAELHDEQVGGRILKVEDGRG